METAVIIHAARARDLVAAKAEGTRTKPKRSRAAAGASAPSPRKARTRRARPVPAIVYAPRAGDLVAGEGRAIVSAPTAAELSGAGAPAPSAARPVGGASAGTTYYTPAPEAAGAGGMLLNYLLGN